MNYTRYWNEGTTILCELVEAVEIGCDQCGATWIHEGLAGRLHPCPYCGASDLNFGRDILLAEQGGASAYARDIRGVVRALWSGLLDLDQAFVIFQDTVRLGLTSAWYEGAAECGISPAELSAAERDALAQAIFTEFNAIFGFLIEVEQNSKANDGKLSPLLSRADMWALRYPDVVTRARLMACADEKLEWGINVTRVVKENCASCLKLNGKVKRASYWALVQVQPQNPPNPKLICGGWMCGCALMPTEASLSKGPLPGLP